VTQSSVELAASAAGDGLVAALGATVARARASALYGCRSSTLRNCAALAAASRQRRAFSGRELGLEDQVGRGWHGGASGGRRVVDAGVPASTLS